MYLKSLKLVGFKSFADRTRLEFRPGVTVIVGPNGSGKSNLVDALSWVLGTQSTKTLRTGKMEDVVFAGTATRPALNRAEAVLGDRQRRAAPSPRSRRSSDRPASLSGWLERLRNQRRQLSTLGYSGPAERFGSRSSSARDHRAGTDRFGPQRVSRGSPGGDRGSRGILKHRRRKEKAERRLERTDEDVLRLQDLLGEIERQLRPLRRQAVAASYERNEVRSLRLYLSGVTLRDLDEEMVGAREEHRRLTAEVTSDEGDVVAIGDLVSGLSTRASTLGSDLERDTGAAALLETTTERLRRMASVAHERSRAASGRLQATLERRTDLESEMSSIRDELSGMDSAAAEATSEAEAREARFRRLEDEERVVATQNAMSAEGAVAAVRGELSVLEAAGVRDERELDAISHRLDVVDGQLRDESTEISTLNEEVRSIDEKPLSSCRRSLTWQPAVARLIRRHGRKPRGASSTAGSPWPPPVPGSRRSPRLWLVVSIGKHADPSRPRPGPGSLISLLDIPAGLEQAVEVALGRWADAVAFDGFESIGRSGGCEGFGGGGVPVVATAGRKRPARLSRGGWRGGPHRPARAKRRPRSCQSSVGRRTPRRRVVCGLVDGDRTTRS